MEFDQIQPVLDRIKYKESFKFKLETLYWTTTTKDFVTMQVSQTFAEIGARIWVYMKVNPTKNTADHTTRDDTGNIEVSHHKNFTPSGLRELTEAALIGSIYEMLREMEVHECAEQFRVDDAIVFNPHELSNCIDPTIADLISKLPESFARQAKDLEERWKKLQERESKLPPEPVVFPTFEFKWEPVILFKTKKKEETPEELEKREKKRLHRLRSMGVNLFSRFQKARAA